MRVVQFLIASIGMNSWLTHIVEGFGNTTERVTRRDNVRGMRTLPYV